MIKYFAILTILLIACARPTPAELPNGISGYAISCVSDFDCATKSSGICKNGYWVATTVRTDKGVQTAEIIVCRN
jgi:hypothetical protein